MSIFPANFIKSMLLFKTVDSTFADIWDLKCKGCTNPAGQMRKRRTKGFYQKGNADIAHHSLIPSFGPMN
jgi:hypothetical protein